MKAFQIVTIEREYASGGTQVGRLLGKALGVPVYGREILEIAAQESGTTPEYIEQLEETDTNSLLYSLVAMGRPPWASCQRSPARTSSTCWKGRSSKGWPTRGPACWWAGARAGCCGSGEMC